MPRPERALDDEDATLARFALGLRALRDNAGRPSYRTLAETTDYSVTTLSEAAGGRYLPTLAVTLAYVRACSGDVGEWEKTWHGVASELAAAAAPESPAEPDGEASPYIGLATFEASDAHRFFGREKVVADLADRVGGQRFVAVFGASGAGKSSILRAGLVAAWTARGKPATLLTPGARPEQAYDAALATLGTGDTDRLLVVDQFEEIFTLCQDEAERERFLARLLPDPRVETGGPRVVIGVRTDFYGHCADHAALAEALQDSQFLVGPMTPDELRAAIIQPAVQAGGNIETPLLAAVIADCAGQPGVLPLLSHALRETWQRRSGTRMTLSGYQAAGGITHAIARTAEHTYDALDARGRQLAKSLFLRLTAPGEGTGDTKPTSVVSSNSVAGPSTALASAYSSSVRVPLSTSLRVVATIAASPGSSRRGCPPSRIAATSASVRPNRRPMCSWAYRSNPLWTDAATIRMAISRARSDSVPAKRMAAPSRCSASPTGGRSSMALNGPPRVPSASTTPNALRARGPPVIEAYRRCCSSSSSAGDRRGIRLMTTDSNALP